MAQMAASAAREEFAEVLNCVAYSKERIVLHRHGKPLPATGESVGIDLGLTDFLVTDTGETVPNPRHFRHGEAVLARRQRALACDDSGESTSHQPDLRLRRARAQGLGSAVARVSPLRPQPAARSGQRDAHQGAGP